MQFKALADKKHEIYDEDLQALVTDARNQDIAEKYSLLQMEASSRMGITPEARLTMTVDGKEEQITSEGDGPVDAIFKAIETVADSGAKLELYSVNAITEGTDSQGEVTVRLAKDGQIVNGNGADTDILVASAKAYINALNLLTSGIRKANPQTGNV